MNYLRHTAVGITLLALAACGTAESGTATQEGPDDEPTAQPDAPTAQPREILSAWAGVVYDVDPVSGPDELLELSSAAGTGTIGTVGVGRVEEFPVQGGEFTNTLSAIEIEMTEVIKGQLEVGDSMWLEVAADPEVLTEALPSGLEVVVYAVPAENASGERYDLTQSVVPDGETLWSTAHAQGLVIGYRPDAGIVEPLSGDVEPSTELSDTLP